MGSEKLTDEWRQTQREGGTRRQRGGEQASRQHASLLIGAAVYI